MVGFFRYPIMALAAVSMILAIFGGLNRMGLGYTWVPASVSLYHGGLMVSGFLGTVIAMERAVSLPVSGALFVPGVNVLGALLVLLGIRPQVGLFLMVLAALGMTGLFGYIYRLQPSLHNSVLVLGGISLTAGNVLWWFGRPVPEFVGWWMGFLILVIAAERLELNRLKQFNKSQVGLFVAGVVLSLAGMIAVPWFPRTGARLYSFGFLGLALWLLAFDMVRNLLWIGGERGYTGWCLFSGYLWLGIGGMLRIVYPGAAAGFFYDAFLHSVFLGFVFTMIFGHAFIIMPGVLNVDLNYHHGFVLPLVFLEGTLALRVVADLMFNQGLRQWAGLGNGLAIGLFFVMLAETGIRSYRTSEE